MNEPIRERFEKAYTELFLVDEVDHPHRIGIMKRGPKQERFPNQFAGAGGVLEKTDEDQAAGMLREWREEMGIDGIHPQEFGRMIIHGKRVIFYFFAHYPEVDIPKSNPFDGISVGEMQWVPVEVLLEKDLVLTTRCFLEVWEKRNWSTMQPFTIFVEREDRTDIMSRIKTVEVREGLLLDR